MAGDGTCGAGKAKQDRFWIWRREMIARGKLAVVLVLATAATTACGTTRVPVRVRPADGMAMAGWRRQAAIRREPVPMGFSA